MPESVPERPTGEAAVLVVAPEPHLQAAYQAEFEARGMRIRTRRSLTGGMADLATNPRLVLVAHELPDGTGLSFARAARKRGYEGPVVLISNRTAPESAAELLPPAACGEGASLRQRLRAYERRLICQTFQSQGRSPKRTAAALGIDRVTLWRKLRSYGADAPNP